MSTDPAPSDGTIEGEIAAYDHLGLLSEDFNPCDDADQVASKVLTLGVAIRPLAKGDLLCVRARGDVGTIHLSRSRSGWFARWEDLAAPKDEI